MHSLEVTCSFLTRRQTTERYKTHSNRTLTAHELPHRHSQFMTLSEYVHVQTQSPLNTVAHAQTVCTRHSFSSTSAPGNGTTIHISAFWCKSSDPTKTLSPPTVQLHSNSCYTVLVLVPYKLLCCLYISKLIANTCGFCVTPRMSLQFELFMNYESSYAFGTWHTSEPGNKIS